MGAGEGIGVVGGVPENPAVIGVDVLQRVVHVDVHVVARALLTKRKPLRLAIAKPKQQRRPVGVVLVVVVPPSGKV